MLSILVALLSGVSVAALFRLTHLVRTTGGAILPAVFAGAMHAICSSVRVPGMVSLAPCAVPAAMLGMGPTPASKGRGPRWRARDHHAQPGRAFSSVSPSGSSSAPPQRVRARVVATS